VGEQGARSWVTPLLVDSELVEPLGEHRAAVRAESSAQHRRAAPQAADRPGAGARPSQARRGSGVHRLQEGRSAGHAVGHRRAVEAHAFLALRREAGMNSTVARRCRSRVVRVSPDLRTDRLLTHVLSTVLDRGRCRWIGPRHPCAQGYCLRPRVTCNSSVSAFPVVPGACRALRLVIRGGTVVDGLDWLVPADVGIAGDRIAFVGGSVSAGTRETMPKGTPVAPVCRRSTPHGRAGLLGPVG